MYYIRYGEGFIYIDSFGDPSYSESPRELRPFQVSKVYSDVSKTLRKDFRLEKIE